MEPQTLKDGGKFPCILHWNFNHFVVLDGFRRERAVLNDPARGQVQVSMEEFDQSFTGVCILLEPGEDYVSDGRLKSMLGFVRKRLTGAGDALIFTSIISLMHYVLGDLSLKIRPGQYVTIVGKTGCGKSTRMRILLASRSPRRAQCTTTAGTSPPWISSPCAGRSAW